MKYSVDRIENDIAILEDISTKEKKEVMLKFLPKNIKDGSILIYNNKKYTLDENEEIIRRNNLRKKFNALKKN